MDNFIDVTELLKVKLILESLESGSILPKEALKKISEVSIPEFSLKKIEESKNALSAFCELCELPLHTQFFNLFSPTAREEFQKKEEKMKTVVKQTISYLEHIISYCINKNRYMQTLPLLLDVRC